MESLRNLWVLCPNCHGKRTCGMIAVDLKARKVTEGDTEISGKTEEVAVGSRSQDAVHRTWQSLGERVL
jgi:hypothetical protein